MSPLACGLNYLLFYDKDMDSFSFWQIKRLKNAKVFHQIENNCYICNRKQQNDERKSETVYCREPQEMPAQGVEHSGRSGQDL